MSTPVISQKRAHIISLGVFLVGLGFLTYYNLWWPGILLVIGAALSVRQGLRGRSYDILITCLIFGGLFLFSYFDYNWNVLMPILFTIGGLYLIFREYFVPKERTGEDQVEDGNREIEDDEQRK